jgi:hypothetical protein
MMYANVYYYLKQRSAILLILMLVLIFSPAICFAQTDPDNPCDGTDPFADCPIDNWVIAFFAIALLLATLYLYNKQKESAR